MIEFLPAALRMARSGVRVVDVMADHDEPDETAATCAYALFRDRLVTFGSVTSVVMSRE